LCRHKDEVDVPLLRSPVLDYLLAAY